MVLMRRSAWISTPEALATTSVALMKGYVPSHKQIVRGEFDLAMAVDRAQQIER